MPGREMWLSPGTLKVHMILSGHGMYSNAASQNETYQAGDCILVPAMYEGVMTAIDETSFLVTTLH